MSSPPGIRTCIGCRRSEDQTALVRVVLQRSQGAQTGVVVLDPKRSFQGRGAWLHPDQECLDRAVKTKAFARSFRTRVDSEHFEGQWCAEENAVLRRYAATEEHPLAQSTDAQASEESE